MEVLLFPVAGQRFAVDARHVERVVADPAAVLPDDTPECDLASAVRDSGHGGPARVVLRVGERRLFLRSGLPEGFVEVEPARLVPLPAFLFEGGRRLVRAVFEHGERSHLLLDETTLAGEVSGWS